MKAHWSKNAKGVILSTDNSTIDVMLTPIEARKLIIEIRNALMDGGCHLKGRVKVLDDKQVYDLIKSGKTYKEVAKLHLCSTGAIQNSLKRHEAKLK